MMDQISPIGHTVSLGAIIGAFVGWLPHVAAALSIVWFCICIHESRPFQHWKRNMQMKRRAKKLAKLKAKEKIVIAEIIAMETVRAAKVEAREMVEDAKSTAAVLVAHEAAQ